MKILLLEGVNDRLLDRVRTVLVGAGHDVQTTTEDSAGIQICKNWRPTAIIACGGGNLTWFLNVLKQGGKEHVPVLLIADPHWRATNRYFRHGVRSVMPSSADADDIFNELGDVTGISSFEIDGTRFRRRKAPSGN